MAMLPPPGGPYIQLAAFCDLVIEGKDGTLSLIRVTDRLMHQAVGTGAPEQMPQVPYIMTAVIALKSGQARGGHAVKIVIEKPSGLRQDGPTVTAMLEGEDRGQNLILKFQMVFEEQGMYWFDVLVNNRLVTRMPWRVIYSRTLIPGPQQGT